MKRILIIWSIFICFLLAAVANDFEKLFVRNGEQIVLDESKELFASPGLGWIFVDNNLDIFLPDYVAQNVKRYDKTGKLLMVYGRPGQGPGEFDLPFMVVVKDNQVIVNDIRSFFFSIFDKSTGKFIKTVQKPTASISLDIDTRERIYCGAVSEAEKGMIYRLSDNYSVESRFFKPSLLTTSSASFLLFSLMDFDSAGNIYVGLRLSYKIAVYDKNLKLLRVFGEPGKNWNQLEKDIEYNKDNPDEYEKKRLQHTFLFDLHVLNDKYLLEVKTVKNNNDAYHLDLYNLNGKKLYKDILANRIIVGRDHQSNIYVYSYKETDNDIQRILCRYRLRNDLK